MAIAPQSFNSIDEEEQPPLIQPVADKVTTNQGNPFDKFGFAEENSNPFDKFGFADQDAPATGVVRVLGDAVQSKEIAVNVEKRRKANETSDGILGDWGKLSPDEQQGWLKNELVDIERQRKELEFDTKKSEKLGANAKDVIAPQRLQSLRENIAKREAIVKGIQDGKLQPPQVGQLRNLVDQPGLGLFDSFAANVIKSAGRAGGYLGRSLGADITPDNNQVVRAGERVSQWAKGLFPGDPARQQEFATKLANGVGQMVGFMVPNVLAAIARAGPTAATGVTMTSGALVSGEEQFKGATEAIKKRPGAVSEDDRLVSYLIGLGLGTTEALPIQRMFGVASNTTRRILSGAGTESLQEGGQQFGSNVTARLFYDPNRKLSEGVVDGMLIGGILGGGFSAALGTNDVAPAVAPPPVISSAQIDSNNVKENVSRETPPPLPGSEETQQPDVTPGNEVAAPVPGLPEIDAGEVVRAAQSVGINLDESQVRAIVEPFTTPDGPQSVPPVLPESETAFQEYVLEGGDLSRRKYRDIAIRVGVLESQVPDLVARAEEAQMVRRDMRGDLRKGPAAVKEQMRRRTDEELGGVLNEAMQAVGKVLPEGFTVQFDRELEAEGKFYPKAGVVSISSAALNPESIIRHEAVHALRSMDVITSTEWGLLKELAEKSGKNATNAQGVTVEEAYREAYADRGNLDEILDQEYIANLLQDYVKGTRYTREVDTILQRVIDFLAALGNALRGRGFQTADDVVARMMSGEMAGRQQSQPGSSGPLYALENFDRNPITPGLDMSQEARLARAREMGFDTDRVLYHGTHSSNIEAFDDAMIGSSNDAGYYGAGHYFSTYKGEARYYGHNVGDYYARGKILDLSNDTGDISYLGHFKSFAPKLQKIGALDQDQSSALEAILKAEKYVDDNATYIQHNNLDGTDGWSVRVPNPAEGYSDVIRMQGDRGIYPATKEEALEMMKYQFKGEMERFHPEAFPGLGTESASLSDYIRADSNIGSKGLTDKARSAGFDGIQYGDEIVIFDPSNIRSVNAAFDPDQVDSPNLLYSLQDQFKPQDRGVKGVNAIARRLALDLGIPVRQGIKTNRSKSARRKSRNAGNDFTSFYDIETGVLRTASVANGRQAVRDLAKAVGQKLTRSVGQPLTDLVNRYAVEIAGPEQPADADLALIPMAPGESTFSGIELDAEAQTLLMETATQSVIYQQNISQVANEASSGYFIGRKQVDRSQFMEAHTQYAQTLRRLRRKVGAKQADTLLKDVRDLAPKDTEASAYQQASGQGYDLLQLPDFIRVRYSESGTPQAAAPVTPGDVFEGFNDWMQNFIDAPDVARMTAPDFFDSFTALIDRESPHTLAVIENAQADIDSYYRANPRERMKSMITPASKRVMFKEFRDNWDKFGFTEALAQEFHDIYTSRIGDNHPYWQGVRELLNIHQANTGQRLNLAKTDNPNITIRMSPHAKIHAARDIEQGIRQLDSTEHSGPSLLGALKIALGEDRSNALDMGPDSAYQDFGAYLMARMGVQRWTKYENALATGDAGGLRPPYNINKEEMEALIQDYERSNPEFVTAADEIYTYQRNLLRIQRDGHLITPEQYEELILEEDYVPSLRSFDEESDITGKGVSGGVGKIIKRFRGSQRNVVDPIASIAQKTFETRLKIVKNKAALQLLDLAEAAGPGAGHIAERMDTQTFKAVQVSIDQALRKAAQEAGVDRHDTFMMVDFAHQILGEDSTATLFTQGQMQPGKEPVLMAMENGKPIAIRLGTDAEGTMGGKLAQQIWMLHQTQGEAAGLFINAASFFSNAVRTGIVTHPEFFAANIWRDAFMAAMYDPKALPFWTQLRGAVDIATDSDAYQRYLAFGGMMGGEATQLVKLQTDNDMEALVERGYQFKVWDTPSNMISHMGEWFSPRNWPDKAVGAAVGGLMGTAFGAPVVGAALGGTIGGQAIVKFGELSETATRVRLMDVAYQRGIKSGLADVEAAQEAAMWSHDYTDYSRHGSKMESWRRMVAFLNANLQGSDIYLRRLTASGDYGTNFSKVMLYPAYKLGLVKFENVTEQEKKDIAFAAYTWSMTIFGLGGIALAQSMLYGDDERTKLLPEHVKSNHWVFPLEDVVHLVSKEAGDEVAKEDILLRMPKPFQTVWFGNLIERLVVEKMKDDPRWAERYLSDLALMNMPPVVPQILQTAGEVTSGVDSYTGRDIIPSLGSGTRRREDQKTPYTSEFAKYMGPKLDVAPAYVDYVVKKLGTSWGRTFLQTNIPGTPWYDPNKPESGLDQMLIARRFLWKSGRGSEAERVFRQDVMGGQDPFAMVWERISTPYSKLGASASSYKENIKNGHSDDAMMLLNKLTPAERGFSILHGHWQGKNSKYRKLHPIERGSTLAKEVSKMQREIVADLLYSGRKNSILREQLTLSPSEKTAARDILTQYKAMELHNALVLSGEVGWENKSFLPADGVLKELEVAVPTVHAEFVKRLDKKHVLPFAGIRQVWPSVKSKLEGKEILAKVKQGEKVHLTYSLIGEWSNAKYAE